MIFFLFLVALSWAITMRFLVRRQRRAAAAQRANPAPDGAIEQ